MSHIGMPKLRPTISRRYGILERHEICRRAKALEFGAAAVGGRCHWHCGAWPEPESRSGPRVAEAFGWTNFVQHVAAFAAEAGIARQGARRSLYAPLMDAAARAQVPGARNHRASGTDSAAES